MAVDLQTVFMVLSDDASNDFCRCPPLSFNLSAVLEKIKGADPVSDFATVKNRIIEEIISGNPHQETFGKIMWSRVCQIILEGYLENLDEVKLSTAQWSNDTKDLYMTITCSPLYLRDLEMFFGAKPLTSCSQPLGLV